jgi:putative sigma-54 modulation protein
MDVIIQGRNIKVTEQLEAYTRKKLDRLDRYLPNIIDVRVDLSNENSKRGGDVAIAQITIRHERGAILRAEEKNAGDIRKAIDAAVDNMYRRIQRFKGKHSRKGAERYAATIEELDIAEEIPDVEVYIEDVPEPAADEPAFLVERRKEIDVTAMNEAEAIEQMELLGHAFFLFFNATTGQLNVLYKRDTGGYGVLVPMQQQ